MLDVCALVSCAGCIAPILHQGFWDSLARFLLLDGARPSGFVDHHGGLKAHREGGLLDASLTQHFQPSLYTCGLLRIFGKALTLQNHNGHMRKSSLTVKRI